MRELIVEDSYPTWADTESGRTSITYSINSKTSACSYIANCGAERFTKVCWITYENALEKATAGLIAKGYQ